MARAPYFIRQLKISPDIVEGVAVAAFIVTTLEDPKIEP